MDPKLGNDMKGALNATLWSSAYPSCFFCILVHVIVNTEGVIGLYRGLSAPLAAQAAYKAIIFGVNSMSQSWLLSRKRQRGGKPLDGSERQVISCRGL